MLGALYHPAAFGYGMIAGTVFGNKWLIKGLLRDGFSTQKMPKNFQLWFKNFDNEKRMNKLRDDE